MSKLHVDWTRQRLRAAMMAASYAVLPGCRPGPDVTVAGSYFPSWMFSLVLGVFATMLCWKLFTRTGLDPYLGPRVLVYPALVILITLILWGMFRG
jgi:hypothetical protein